MLHCVQYEKGCDEDGPEPYPFRELPVGERQQDASIRPITSELKCRAVARCLRLPALRDSACWSVKGQRKLQFEWYRGYCIFKTRLKEFETGLFYLLYRKEKTL